MEMTVGDALYHTSWQPASGAKAGWRVARYDSCNERGVDTLIEYKGSSGRVVYFGSYDTAKKKADELNKAIS